MIGVLATMCGVWSQGPRGSNTDFFIYIILAGAGPPEGLTLNTNTAELFFPAKFNPGVHSCVLIVEARGAGNRAHVSSGLASLMYACFVAFVCLGRRKGLLWPHEASLPSSLRPRPDSPPSAPAMTPTCNCP